MRWSELLWIMAEQWRIGGPYREDMKVRVYVTDWQGVRVGGPSVVRHMTMESDGGWQMEPGARVFTCRTQDAASDGSGERERREPGWK